MTDAAPRKRADDGQTDADIAQAVDAFRRILRELRVVARKTELATGLSAAQVFVLSVVIDAPGCSVNDIAAATMTDRSSAAAVVDRLVENGHLVRRQADDDRRRAAISITPAGRRAMKRASPPPTALLIAALRRVDPLELDGLASGLAALTRAMGIANEPAGMLFEDAPKKAPRGSTSRPRRG
jgi:DNA-binding MarR family transcriptional regulator